MREGFIRKFTLSVPVDYETAAIELSKTGPRVGIMFKPVPFDGCADLKPWHVLTAWRDETEYLLDRIDRAATERSEAGTRRWLDEKLKQGLRWKKVGTGLVLGDGKTVVFGQVMEGQEPGGLGARLMSQIIFDRDLITMVGLGLKPGTVLRHLCVKRELQSVSLRDQSIGQSHALNVHYREGPNSNSYLKPALTTPSTR